MNDKTSGLMMFSNYNILYSKPEVLIVVNVVLHCQSLWSNIQIHSIHRFQWADVNKSPTAFKMPVVMYLSAYVRYHHYVCNDFFSNTTQLIVTKQRFTFTAIARIETVTEYKILHLNIQHRNIFLAGHLVNGTLII